MLISIFRTKSIFVIKMPQIDTVLKPLSSPANSDVPSPVMISPVAELQTLLANDMQRVDREIEDSLISPVSLISQITRHIIHAGGKRIRPLLTIAFSRLFDCDNQATIKLAAAVEFIHTATLLHDDVVDDSHLRRGKLTARDLWGNQASVLVGDFLFSRSFQLMVQTHNPAVLDVLARASVQIAQGEVLQLANSHDLSITQDIAFDIIKAKTAELFAAACQVGIMVAKQSEEITENARLYGEYLGMIFQITDDILDYNGDIRQAGKAMGTDFKEGKVTLPVIFAYDMCNDIEKEFFRRTLIEKDQGPDDFENARRLIIKYDGFDMAMECAQEFAHKAQNALTLMPDSRIKKYLNQIIDHCLNRNY